tara:strand:- start:196 stop:447 length:252 start_codon:yes stop_codon:yes gene_type:complete
MISNERTKEVLTRFFEAIKSKDYEVSDGITYYQLLDIIYDSSMVAIEKNPDKFEALINWVVNASMYLLNDINELDEIDLGNSE